MKIQDTSKLAIMLEVPCEECKGTGKVDVHLCDSDGHIEGIDGKPIPGWKCPGVDQCGEKQVITCDGCQGTGYQQQRIKLNTLKRLLEVANE